MNAFVKQPYDTVHPNGTVTQGQVVNPNGTVTNDATVGAAEFLPNLDPNAPQPKNFVTLSPNAQAILAAVRQIDAQLGGY